MRLVIIYQSIKIGLFAGLQEMVSHKFRSFLSLLGVMMGVGALVAMLTIMGGVDDFLHRQMGRIAGRVGIHQSDQPEDIMEAVEWGRSPGFRAKDLGFLESLGSIKKVFHTMTERTTIWAGNEKLRIRVTGTDKNNLDNEFESGITLSQGRTFTQQEYEDGSLVTIIPWMAEEKLSQLNSRRGGGEPYSVVGQYIYFMSNRFEIIGVFETANQGHMSWRYRSNFYIPINTMNKYISGYNNKVHFTLLEVEDVEKLYEQVAQAGFDLESHHRAVPDFEFQIFETANEFIQVIQNLNIVFGIIAIISLCVGGMGIMNVVLSSISERIREIGVRKALGASGVQIFVQVISETVSLSCLGGFIGALLGALPIFFAEAIYKAGGGLIKPQLEPLYVVAILVVIILEGVVFGLYPALKASRLDPIDALRYE